MTIRSFVFALFAAIFLVGCGTDGEAERMAEEHEGDTPEATAAAGSPAVTVEDSTVEYGSTEDGEAMTGYLAEPQQADSVLEAQGMDPETQTLPGIVVIHEWWGLNDNIRAATRRLAGEGYRALAVDLYGGAVAETPDSAQTLVQEALEQESRLLANIQSAEDYLRTEANAPRVAVLGWCFGGSRTFSAVASMPTQFDAAVVYYGSPDDLTEEEIRPIETPILGHFGLEDESIPIEDVRAFDSTMADLDKEFELYEYEADHAFANPSGTQYDPTAADSAWARTTDFLRTHLYPEAGNN